MASPKIIAAVAVFVGFSIISKASNALPAPDSAGIVEMNNGLAYGGIPYGSVSGMLRNTIPQNQEMHYAQDLQQTSVHVPNGKTNSQDVFKIIGLASSIGY